MKRRRPDVRGSPIFDRAAGAPSCPVHPLNVLLSHALLDLTRRSERAGAEEIVLWSNLLRVVGDDGVERKELPRLVRLSKRAVRTISA